MDKSNIVNKEKLLYSYNFKYFFLKKMYGLKLKALNIFKQRLEIFSKCNITDLNPAQYKSLLNTFYQIIPSKKCLKDRNLVNILFLDVINSYRGWRHSRGLPVRGQRTWSNAWSSYRSNLVLREHRIVLARRIYGNIPLNELNVASLAEQINTLWKLQWAQEWREAKKKRLTYLKKNINLYKVDLYSMSRGIVSGFSKRGEKGRKQKQKQIAKKNYFSLGFEPGFTKNLLKLADTSNKKVGAKGKVSVITNPNDVKLKKKVLKKKKIVPITKKKKKNSSWN